MTLNSTDPQVQAVADAATGDATAATAPTATVDAKAAADTAALGAVNPLSVSIRDAYLKDLSRLDSHISDEYQWIGQRISWLLVTNSFLLLSFMSTSNFLVNTGSSPYIRLAVVYMLGIPIVGFVSSLLVLVGVWAAQAMVKKIKTARNDVQKVFESVPFPYKVIAMGTTTGSWPNVCGKAAGYWMPILLMLLWASIVFALLWSNPFWDQARGFFRPYT